MIQEERMMIVMLAGRVSTQYRRGVPFYPALCRAGDEFVKDTGFMYSEQQARSWIASEIHRQRRLKEAKHKKASSGKIKDRRGVYTQLTMF